ncbi:MAG TPA: hypothetical protein ENI87_04465, partial [bacterium]|nr:hypothetical protein [bacterium]
MSVAATTKSARRMRRRRLFVFILLLFVWGVFELLGFAAWTITTGRLFSWSDASEQRRLAIAESGGDVELDQDLLVRGAVRHGSMLHPFLGFVHAPPQQPDPPLPVTAFGFHGEREPVQKRAADRYLVGVTGGSVALHFTLYGRDAFIKALQRSPQLRGREIEVIALALGGYKQPQQLLAVQLISALGGEFDCIVNLDGFNEVALVNENVPMGVPGWYPRSWNNLATSVPDPEQLRRIGQLGVMTDERRSAAEAAGFWWWSPLWQFVWSWRDRDLKNRIDALRVAAEQAARSLPPAAIGPGTGGKSLAEARREMVDVWRRCSEQLAAHCNAHGIAYLHFLQPNQYVPGSKPILPAEAKVAIDPEHPWREGVLDGYPLLQAAGVELKLSGVDFTDLTPVFAGIEEPLYFDTCCHFGRRGHAIVAEHIAAAIRRRIELGGVRIERLRVEPTELRLGSPLQAV